MKHATFSKMIGGLRALQQPWLPADQNYPHLLNLGAVAPAKDGIYAIWHLGVRPQWLRVGATANLAAALTALARLPWTLVHQSNGGIFVAWAHPPKEQQAGIARFLVETLNPAFQEMNFALDLTFDRDIVPHTFPLPPGTRP